MKITMYNDTVPYIIIDDIYDKQDLDLIHTELERLYPTFRGPEETGSALSKNNVFTKKNSGLWLDTLFKNDRSQSVILNKNRKLFSKDFFTEIKQLHHIYGRFLEKCTFDTTLLSYYDTGGYYKPHSDNAAVTAVTWFHKTPKNFTGGDLYLSDFDIKVEPRDNRCLIFFSVIDHHVSDVEITDESQIISGRFAMSQFINMRP